MEKDMVRHFILRLILGVLSIYVSGCSVSSSDAPRTDQAHPPRYILSHATEANADLFSCQSCHGLGFAGSGDAVTSCLSCHESGPPFSLHSLPYTDPADHGPAAKANQLLCRGCHGTALNNFDGGIVSDPNLFNYNAPSCSSAACHPTARAHPTNWQGTNDDSDPSYDSTHRTINLNIANTSCVLCHKTNGPGTGPLPNAPSCFSANYTNSDGVTTGCHASGPGFVAPHALPYTDPGDHGPDAKADLKYCQRCHASPSNSGAGSNPRFNVAVGNLVNGCEDCHRQNTAHPYPSWSGGASNNHKTAGNLGVACALCHGANLLGPAEGGVGPACDDCHTAGSPLVLTDCSSCHNDPPDGAAPAGNSRPNRAGAHSVHDALQKVTGICNTCHSGSGTNTNNHYDTSAPANVAGLASYDAKSGIFSYNSSNRTCSNVSCHGGQPTPDWLTGTLDVAANCESCHVQGTSQYNSYDSGRHDLHVNDENLACTECHDPVKLSANHFIGLDTPTFEGAADATINDSLSYNPATNSGCNVAGCHGEEDWF
jgi:predicted CxxxxCH...CXXCH cytochrome family protein